MSARQPTRTAPVDHRGKVEMHCPACHVDTWMRRVGEGRGACWECGTSFDVKACYFHDKRIAVAGSVGERLDITWGEDTTCDWWRGDDVEDPCREEWTREEIEALPRPWLADSDFDECDDCPAEYVVTRMGEGELTYFLRFDDEWDHRAYRAVRWYKPELAYKQAAKHLDAVPHRLDRVL